MAQRADPGAHAVRGCSSKQRRCIGLRALAFASKAAPRLVCRPRGLGATGRCTVRGDPDAA